MVFCFIGHYDDKPVDGMGYPFFCQAHISSIFLAASDFDPDPEPWQEGQDATVFCLFQDVSRYSPSNKSSFSN
jgi:hypothetical protein